jgi:hypothetical protein
MYGLTRPESQKNAQTAGAIAELAKIVGWPRNEPSHHQGRKSAIGYAM